MVYYTYLESPFFFLVNDMFYFMLKIIELMNLKLFNFYFLKIDISVTIYAIDLTFSVCFFRVPLEGRVSQISHLGPSLFFLSNRYEKFFVIDMKRFYIS